MSIVTHEQFKQFFDDSKWLQKNYNELIKEFNLEYIAIINHKVVAHHKEMNEFERELKQNNLPILDAVVEFIRDKCMQLLYSLYIWRVTI
jgi:predicted house-cleaning noncanonical NTP pyrophosphatase (MazG superfamily)